MIHEQIAQIAEMIDALTDPVREIEEKALLHDEMLTSQAETLALHTEQIEQLLSLPPVPPPPPPGDAIYSSCFNAGNCDGNNRPLGIFWNQNPPEVVMGGDHDVVGHEGTHMMRTYLHRHESKHSYRTMAIIKADDRAEPSTTPDGDEVLHMSHNQDYWVALSMFLPADWVFDPLTTILFQCKCRPDPTEEQRQPAFCINTRDDEWEAVIRWDPRVTTPPGEGTHYPHSIRPYTGQSFRPDLGRWTNWLFHFRWHWVDGLTQVWKNGEMVIDYEGGNCANDKKGLYISFGLYDWAWKEKWWDKFIYNTEWRRMWFDSFRVGHQRTDVI